MTKCTCTLDEITAALADKRPPAPSITTCRGCGARCDYRRGYGMCVGQVLYHPDYGEHRRHACEAHEALMMMAGGGEHGGR